MNVLFRQLESLLMVAQGTAESAAPPKGGSAPIGGDASVVQPGGGGLIELVPMLVAFMLLFYLFILRPQQREQKLRQQKLDALKKNDRVVTAGGIVGTIAGFSDDGTLVTLKVDDSTRIKFTKASIQGPLGETNKDGRESKSDDPKASDGKA